MPDLSSRTFHPPGVVFLVCVLFLLAFVPILLADDQTDDDVPPGFENIDTPRTTEIEVWYGGRLRGRAIAEFTSRWIRFRQPDKVAGLIPGLVAKEHVVAALSGEISSHKQQICRTEQQEACGLIEPEIAGVIFDAGNFTAVLFVAPIQLQVRQMNRSRYLGEASSSGFTAIQGLSLSLSGSRAKDNNNDHFSWYGRSVAALGESHLFADWSYDKAEHFSLSSLYAERDWQGQEMVGGLFNSNSIGLSFSADPQLLGVRFAHSTDSMSSDTAVNTTPIVVYLPVRGRVEVYRNDKLLDARILEAGRQQLDTQGFPQGAYKLTIKVYDGPRLLAEKQKLFVKSNNLPGKDEPIYFFEMGRPVHNTTERKVPQIDDGWVARGGYSRLVGNQTGLTLAATVENSDALAETGLVYLGESLEWSAGLMVGRHHRSGGFGNLLWEYRGWQLQALYRELSASGQDDDSGLLGSGFRNGQLSAGVSLGDTTVNFGREWREDESDKGSKITDHVRIEWLLLRDSAYELRFGIDASQGVGNGSKSSQVLASISLVHRADDRQLTFSQSRQEKRSSGSRRELQQVSRAGARWQELTVADQNVTAGGFIENQRQQRSVGADMTFSGRWAGGRMAINRTVPDKGINETSYTASLSTSMLARPEGVALGGRRLSDSAVIVELAGEEELAERASETDSGSDFDSGWFDILVNDKMVTRGRAGDAIPVVLAPFRNYRLAIQPATDNFSDYDSVIKPVTLYPGNVVHMAFSIIKVEPVLGRLIDREKKAIADAVIESSHDPSFTDSNGLFQGRLKPSITTLEVTLPDGSKCKAKLPDDRRLRRGVVILGTMPCL